MAILTNFMAFNQATETWASYLARSEYFLRANDFVELSSSRKQAYFLSFCGSEMFNTAQALAAPQPITSVSWEVLLAKLRNHYVPMPSQISCQHAFHRRYRAEGETINQHIATLRATALYCEF